VSPRAREVDQSSRENESMVFEISDIGSHFFKLMKKQGHQTTTTTPSTPKAVQLAILPTYFSDIPRPQSVTYRSPFDAV